MNYFIFLSLLNLILIARMRLIFRDEGVNQKDLWVLGGIPLISLLFLQVNVGWFLLLLYLLFATSLTALVERYDQKRNRNRLLILLMHIVVIGLLCSPAISMTSNGLTRWVISFFNDVFLHDRSLQMAELQFAQVMLLGFLMVLNEANIVLRWILQLVGLEKLGAQGEEVDKQEYNTGRLIGLLERIFVFLFVLIGQYTAIGFILAAKGVARFQDFKSRTFAEYVLIGTLLSSLLAMIIAYLVKLMLF